MTANHAPRRRNDHLLSIALALSACIAGPVTAQELAAKPSEPLDFLSPAELLVARTRFAWCSSLAPDETWLATGYGHWAGNEAGRVVVWDLAKGAPKWQANEPRGVRSVAISPDGSLVACGNFAGEIRLRDAATGKVVRAFRQDRGSVERICFSSDGKRLATSSNTTHLVRVWNAVTGEVLQTLGGHTEVPYWVEFSPDDSLLVSAGRDGGVRLWNLEKGSVQQTFPHGGEVTSAIFLPGGKQVASVAHDGIVRLWNIETGKVDQTLTPPGTRSTACAVAVSRDGKQLASGNYNRIHLWNLASGELEATLDGHVGLVHGLTFNKRGEKLISSSWDNTVRIWDPHSKQAVQSLRLPATGSEPSGPIAALAHCPSRSMLATAVGAEVELRAAADGRLLNRLQGHEEPVLALAFSPEGKWLATAGGDHRLRLWDLETLQAEVVLPHHTDAVHAVAWSPDGTRLASGGSDQTVRIFDTKTWKILATLEGHSAPVLAVALLADGRAVSAGEDAIVRVWDVAGKKQIAALEGHSGSVRAIAIAPGGATIATAGDDKSVKLWDAASLQPRASINGHQQPVLCLAFSPQGKTLASGAAGGGLHYLDPARGTVRKTTSTHSGRITGIAFLPEAEGVLSAGEDATIRVWRAAEPPIPPLVSLPAHGASAYAVSFSPDGKWLATGGKDKLVALRNPMTGEIVRTFPGHNGLVYDVAFSPDSELLASGSSDGAVRIWSLGTGGFVASFKGWKDRLSNVRAVAFSPDGRTVVAGTGDGTIRLFDVKTKRVTQDLTGQTLPVTGVQFSPDGTLLATSTGDWQRWRTPGELRLWNAKTGEELAALPGHAGEIKRVVFSPSGRRMASVAGWIFVWNVEERNPTANIRLGDSPTTAAFLKDENRLAVGDLHGGVLLWDIARQAVVRRFAGHDGQVAGLAVSPDGERLATVAHDGVLHLWPLGER
jgi:WD40 repeat protein